MDYEKLEEMNRAKKNINQTYHLHHQGHLPTVAWESSLREALGKGVRKKKGENENKEAGEKASKK